MLVKNKKNSSISPRRKKSATDDSIMPVVAEPLRVKERRPLIPLIKAMTAQIKDASGPTNGINQIDTAMIPQVSEVIA
jgi:hypothetical protein